MPEVLILPVVIFAIAFMLGYCAGWYNRGL